MTHQPAKDKLSITDLMILVAGTAAGLACFLVIDGNMYGGGQTLFGLLNPPPALWTTRTLLDRVEGALSAIETMVGGWTLVVPLLTWLRPRGVRNRMMRGAGYSGCVAACVGIAAVVGTTAVSFLCRRLDGWRPLPANYWYATPILEGLFLFAGVAVGSTWVTLLLSGRWHALPNAIDRIGRGMGVLWIVAGVAFAVRLWLGPA